MAERSGAIRVSAYMRGDPRQHDPGLAAALGFHLLVYSAAAACFGFGFGFYELLQPSRLPNPGLEAYKPPPGTVIADAQPSRPADRAAPSAPVIAMNPEPETTGQSAPPADETKARTREAQKAKSERPKRERAARRKERHDPMMGYAAQPFFGGYRPF